MCLEFDIRSATPPPIRLFPLLKPSVEFIIRVHAFHSNSSPVNTRHIWKIQVSSAWERRVKIRNVSPTVALRRFLQWDVVWIWVQAWSWLMIPTLTSAWGAWKVSKMALVPVLGGERVSETSVLPWWSILPDRHQPFLCPSHRALSQRRSAYDFSHLHL